MFHGHLDYFHKPLIGGRPSKKMETLAVRMFTTVDLFYFIMCEDPHELRFIEIAFGFRVSGHI